MMVVVCITKCMFSRSVYDLVKVSYFLELTDPKLCGWYLSISPEDRELIQGMDIISLALHIQLFK